MYKNSKRITSIFVIICFVIFPYSSFALPTGQNVVDDGGGSVTFSNPDGNTLNITQTADKMITEWESFSIAHPETVNFFQPSSMSVALNRVVGLSPSEIYGALNANGKVFIINPNGILFSPSSSVNVGGLLASTLDIENADFMSGNYKFYGPGSSVINYGDIFAPGGYVVLLGSSVKNVGLIQANLGKVILAAGEKITLDLDPTGLISVAVDITQGTDRNDDGQYAAVINRGTIKADGGKVILTADILNDVFDSAVNNDGIIEANTMEEVGGQVLLKSNQNIELNGKIVATDTIDAFAKDNVILGKPIDDLTVSSFSWKYLRGDRGYRFSEFGYYLDNGNTRVILSQGADIGNDVNSPTSGGGVKDMAGTPQGIYTVFGTDENPGLLTFFEDVSLNPDGEQHIIKTNTEYAWEDFLGLGDKDFNDAVIDFVENLSTIKAPDAILSAPNVFLTANQGEIIQHSGEIQADNLMLVSNTGISGTGSNGGLSTKVDNLSALNKTSGGILIDNQGTLAISDLSGISGLNNGVTGKNGVENKAVGGEIDINVSGTEGTADLNINAPIVSHGPVVVSADGNINHSALGDVTIHNINLALTPPTPINLASPSHVVGQVTTDNTVDVTWELPEPTSGFGYTATAGGSYNMAPGAEIKTNGGDVNITANDDVSISLVDAGNANAVITSNNGSIIDADKGTAPSDFDVVAYNIKLSAPNGTVGSSGPEEEIDLGFPFTFSLLFDNSDSTDPDLSTDIYASIYDPISGDWSFAAVSDPLTIGSWWFHVATLEETGSSTVASASAHLGPFILEATPPPPPPPPEEPNRQPWEAIEDELRVYYEILHPSQYLSFEPATKIGLYAYHPLTPTDDSAFDNIKLDAAAYEFIEGNINMKNKIPYYGIQ